MTNARGSTIALVAPLPGADSFGSAHISAPAMTTTTPSGNMPTPQLQVSSTHVEFTSIEHLFRTKPLAQIRALSRETEKNLTQKRKDLRLMVGNHYRQVLESSDLVKQIQLCATEFRGCLQVIEQIQQQPVTSSLVSIDRKRLAALIEGPCKRQRGNIGVASVGRDEHHHASSTKPPPAAEEVADRQLSRHLLKETKTRAGHGQTGGASAGIAASRDMLVVESAVKEEHDAAETYQLCKRVRVLLEFPEIIRAHLLAREFLQAAETLLVLLPTVTREIEDAAAGASKSEAANMDTATSLSGGARLGLTANKRGGGEDPESAAASSTSSSSGSPYGFRVSNFLEKSRRQSRGSHNAIVCACMEALSLSALTPEAFLEALVCLIYFTNKDLKYFLEVFVARRRRLRPASGGSCAGSSIPEMAAGARAIVPGAGAGPADGSRGLSLQDDLISFEATFLCLHHAQPQRVFAALEKFAQRVKAGERNSCSLSLQEMMASPNEGTTSDTRSRSATPAGGAGTRDHYAALCACDAATGDVLPQVELPTVRSVLANNDHENDYTSSEHKSQRLGSTTQKTGATNHPVVSVVAAEQTSGSAAVSDKSGLLPNFSFPVCGSLKQIHDLCERTGEAVWGYRFQTNYKESWTHIEAAARETPLAAAFPEDVLASLRHRAAREMILLVEASAQRMGNPLRLTSSEPELLEIARDICSVPPQYSQNEQLLRAYSDAVYSVFAQALAASSEPPGAPSSPPDGASLGARSASWSSFANASNEQVDVELYRLVEWARNRRRLEEEFRLQDPGGRFLRMLADTAGRNLDSWLRAKVRIPSQLYNHDGATPLSTPAVDEEAAGGRAKNAATMSIIHGSEQTTTSAAIFRLTSSSTVDQDHIEQEFSRATWGALLNTDAASAVVGTAVGAGSTAQQQSNNKYYIPLTASASLMDFLVNVCGTEISQLFLLSRKFSTIPEDASRRIRHYLQTEFEKVFRQELEWAKKSSAAAASIGPRQLQLLFDAKYVSRLCLFDDPFSSHDNTLATSSSTAGNHVTTLIEGTVFADPVDRLLYSQALDQAVQEFLESTSLLLSPLFPYLGSLVLSANDTATSSGSGGGTLVSQKLGKNSGAAISLFTRPEHDPPLCTHAMRFPLLPIPESQRLAPLSSIHAGARDGTEHSIKQAGSASLFQNVGLSQFGWNRQK
ncbi:unnamed protein product [Amoebophrya sp. A120]|nr:unnamed protein product [Amoebophrya sp. A120]|eukprot:GSA120T00018017001.1